MIFENKTNKKWYAYEDMGSYYKLIGGSLRFCPMNKDGTRDDNVGEVDWELLEGERLSSHKILTERLEEICRELLVKN